MYLDDYNLNATIDFKFTTRKSTGLPTQLAGTPAVSVYKTNSVTQTTTGVTLTVDFDSVTGLNHVRIDTSADGTFYAAGCDFAVVITAGTVDSISVVGETVATFSILNRSALRPTTAGRTLDVSTGGEAGIDWANVGSPTTTVNLSGTTVKTATDVETDTQDIQSRIPAALTAGGNMKSDTLAINAVSTSSVTTVSAYLGSTGAAVNGTNVNTLASHDPGATLGTSTLTQAQVTGGAYALNSASFAFNAALDFTTTQKAATLARVTLVDTTTTNSDMITQANVRSAVGLASANLDTQIGTLATAANLATVAGYLDTEIAAILADTNELQTDWANGGRLDVILDARAATADIAAAIVTYGLDHLVYTSVVGTDVADNSIIAKLASKSATADWDTFNNTTESHEALRDRGDAAWTSGSSSITVSPTATNINDRVTASTITCYYGEEGFTIGPNAVTDANDDPVNLSSYTSLRFTVQDQYGTDLLSTTTITVSGASSNQWTVTGTSALTGTAPAKLAWSLRGISTGVDVVLGLGTMLVVPAAKVDS